ncbi:MBL fold metallo-hydrolase [Phyllobacterium myrsinacearum]|uniref:L-ascorbate metabolism protein UlaG (Beta-lactamase superfamily) n=1 Tax=Phyllobacterium myrsinacearum TaxID=28101 RepID=A0A839ESV7_9HYPH|nr:MBL fold metallo-hydrolase [Phyllobacterium myrsinacearum]MBA8880456.1 L-ascorbate metabolism protein UlaG (beta-lactamase superfamily) [Phyllobacterium myrsinacearum]
MQMQLIRNATLKLDYAGSTILIDPFFALKHSQRSITGRSPNPMTDLPASTDEILAGVELVLVSHLHADHFDPVAQELTPKHLPLICQPGDEETIRSFGFTDVTPLTQDLTWKNIRLTRRDGNHGTGAVLQLMGNVIGFTIEADNEPSIYWAGDTILYPPVIETIEATQPDIIITHSCGAKWDGVLIVMDAEQTVEVCRIAPQKTKIIATHMEALDHATVTRNDLKAHAQAAAIDSHKLIIPSDGEILHLTAPNS